MTDQSTRNSILLAAVSWAAITVVAGLILLYLDCQNTDNRIQKCLEMGKDPHACECMFARDYKNRSCH